MSRKKVPIANSYDIEDGFQNFMKHSGIVFDQPLAPPVQEETTVISAKNWKSNNSQYCTICREGGEVLCCDACPASFHLMCHEPIIRREDIPSGKWLCNRCKMTPSGMRPAKSSIDPFETEEVRQRIAIERVLRECSEEAKTKPLDVLAKAAVAANAQQFELPPSIDPRRSELLPFAEMKHPKPAVTGHTCAICRTIDDSRVAIGCDFCPAVIHLDCLEPPLCSPPRDKWMCPFHPHLTVDEKLLRSTSLVERRAHWNKYANQPIEPIAVLAGFFRKNKNKKKATKHAIRVPSVIKAIYADGGWEAERRHIFRTKRERNEWLNRVATSSAHVGRCAILQKKRIAGTQYHHSISDQRIDGTTIARSQVVDIKKDESDDMEFNDTGYNELPTKTSWMPNGDETPMMNGYSHEEEEGPETAIVQAVVAELHDDMKAALHASKRQRRSTPKPTPIDSEETVQRVTSILRNAVVEQEVEDATGLKKVRDVLSGMAARKRQRADGGDDDESRDPEKRERTSGGEASQSQRHPGPTGGMGMGTSGSDYELGTGPGGASGSVDGHSRHGGGGSADERERERDRNPDDSSRTNGSNHPFKRRRTLRETIEQRLLAAEEGSVDQQILGLALQKAKEHERRAVVLTQRTQEKKAKLVFSPRLFLPDEMVLAVLHAEHTQTVHAIQRRVTTIGTQETCHIILDGDHRLGCVAQAPTHATIVRNQDQGTWELMLYGMAHVEVDGIRYGANGGALRPQCACEPVAPRAVDAPAPLRNNSVIRFGCGAYVFATVV